MTQDKAISRRQRDFCLFAFQRFFPCSLSKDLAAGMQAALPASGQPRLRVVMERPCQPPALSKSAPQRSGEGRRLPPGAGPQLQSRGSRGDAQRCCDPSPACLREPLPAPPVPLTVFCGQGGRISALPGCSSAPRRGLSATRAWLVMECVH